MEHYTSAHFILGSTQNFPYVWKNFKIDPPFIKKCGFYVAIQNRDIVGLKKLQNLIVMSTSRVQATQFHDYMRGRMFSEMNDHLNVELD